LCRPRGYDSGGTCRIHRAYASAANGINATACDAMLDCKRELV
jgi:hypothetical protein